MEAKLVTEIPAGDGWLYEPKWDGFRCLAFRAGDQVLLQSKAGQPLGRYFPELVAALMRLGPARVVGGFRWAQSGGEVGSLLLGLYDEDGLLHHVGFSSSFTREERRALEPVVEGLIAAGDRGLGAISGPPGSTIAPPGFTGSAPGGPSRWATERSTEWQPLRPVLVAEVRYDHFSGDRFRHGTKFVRWRPDKDPRRCTFDQLETRGGRGALSELVTPRGAAPPA